MPRKLIFLTLLLSLTGCAAMNREILISNGDVAGLQKLLDEGKNIRPNKSLCLAVTGGHHEVLPFLIANGANPNRLCGFTLPLTLAVQFNYWTLVQVLLDNGADVESAHEELQGAGLLASTRAQYKQRAQRLRKLAAETKLRLAAPVAPAAAPAPEKAAALEEPSYRRAEDESAFALVIGIEEYSDLPKAAYAEQDAAAVTKHIKALGVPVRNTRFLAGPKAGLSAFAKNLEAWLPNNVREGSRVYFYFSGHGAPDPETGEAYLIPWDGDANYLKTTAYPLKKLYAKLDALPAKEVVVVLDSCFSGAGGRSVLAKGARPLVTKIDTAPTGRTKLKVLAAAGPSQITATLEEAKQGLFTYYLLQGLNGAAESSKGRVTLQDLYRYLSPKVQDEAGRQNREQSPTLSEGPDVVLRSLLPVER